jgi:hypothetical protein
MRGDREMIGGVISFRKSNEYSPERRAGDYGSSSGGKKRRKIQVDSSLPENLGVRFVRNSEFFRTLDVEYGVCIVYYVIFPAGSAGSTP